MKGLRFYLFVIIFLFFLFFSFGCFNYLRNTNNNNYNDIERGFVFNSRNNDIKGDTIFSMDDFFCIDSSYESVGHGISYVDENYLIERKNVSSRNINIKNRINEISEEVKKENGNGNFSGNKYGIVLYEIPDTMKVGNSYVAKLRISNGGGDIILEGIDIENNNKKIKVIKSRIGRIMGVKLSNIGNEKDFDIRLLNSEVQVIEEGRSYTSWEWVITPLIHGKKILKMVIIIKEGDFVKDVPVYEDYIYIRSSPGFYLRGFIEKYWQWLLGTIIIPLFLFIWSKRKKKDKKSGE
jgi:hypothetical protein